MKYIKTAILSIAGLVVFSGSYGQDISGAMRHIFMRQYDSAKIVINNGVDVNQRERDSYLINSACYRGNLDMVRFLIDKGADVNVVAGDGGTPLFWAAGSDNNGELVQLLLDHGARIDVKNKAGTTPYEKAVYRAISKGDNFEVLKVFLDQGIDVDTAPEEGPAAGYTPLMGAVINNQAKLTKFLLDHGANINAVASDGNTSLLMATGEGNLKLVKLLTEQGARTDHTNSKGETALRIAEKKGHLDIVKYLQESQ